MKGKFLTEINIESDLVLNYIMPFLIRLVMRIVNNANTGAAQNFTNKKAKIWFLLQSFTRFSYFCTGKKWAVNYEKTLWLEAS